MRYVPTFAFLLLVLIVSSGRTQTVAAPSQRAESPYKVLSSTPDEIRIEVHPHFIFENVVDFKTGRKLTKVGATGATFAPMSGSTLPAGSPGIPSLVLPLIVPSKTPVEVTISGDSYENIKGELAPVPEYSFSHHAATPEYSIGDSLYAASQNTAYAVSTGTQFRTAYSQTVTLPLARDNSGAIAILKHAIVTIHIPSGAASLQATHASAAEREMFERTFINGDATEYYNSARDDVIRGLESGSESHGFSVESATGAQWLMVQTPAQGGVMRIAAQDLTSKGIGTPIEAATIQLFGTGGAMLNESVTPTSGELRECAIEAHANPDGTLQDFYFYAPPTTVWTYQSSYGSSTLSRLFHIINSYNSTGYYLLKIGGSQTGLRIAVQPDSLSGTPQPSTSVLTATVQEDEKFFEHLSVGRELLGSQIPYDGSTLGVTVQSPGFTSSDWAYLRVAFDSRAQSAHSVSVAMNNGIALGSISGAPVVNNGDPDEAVTSRTWNQGFSITSALANSATVNLSLSITQGELTPQVYLDWLELFYHRTPDLSLGQIPFMVVDTGGSFAYQFRNAKNGEVWDITTDNQPVVIAQDLAGSGTIAANIEGVSGAMRQFVACSPATVLHDTSITQIAAPTLRTSIGEVGAEDIIIAPEEFLAEADSLQALRQAGGQATAPLSATVVTVEQIYNEFGYGGHDVTAIRDFMAYLFRHTTASGSTKPIFLTLFGAGHADYQGRVGSPPERVPAYEYPDWFSRNDALSKQESYTDDSFFGRLTNNSVPDVGVGRISAESDADAQAVLAKLQQYERGSDQGLWRGLSSFVSDDRLYTNGTYDPIGSTHIEITEEEEAYVPQRVRVNKVYEVNYPYQITSGGYTRPGANSAILQAFNQGTVLLSFVGHGNPNVWTHETVLSVPSTIYQMTNFTHLPFVTTATCDFTVCDDYSQSTSGGVLLLIYPNGGAVSILGTNREVTPQDGIPTSFYRALFDQASICASHSGSAHLGTAIVAMKVANGGSNIVNFYLQGDPALQLLIPRQYVRVDSINGVAIGGAPIKLQALSQVSIAAHISNSCDGSDLDQTFSGTATVSLIDAPISVTRLSTYTDNPDTDFDTFNMEGPILFRGDANVSKGRMNASFVIPKDIEVDTNKVELNLIAYASDNRSALGCDTSMQLQPPTTSPKDTAGPKLAGWIGSRLFEPGDTVATNSVLIVDIHDEYGLNTSTASIGHSFAAWIDDSTNNLIDLSAGYVASESGYTSGTSTDQVTLPVGPHVLHVRAFDALDNPATIDLPFVGRSTNTLGIYQVRSFPSPTNDRSSIVFTQTAGEGVPVDINLSLYSMIGQRVRVLDLPAYTSTFVEVPWDGRDGVGNPVASGAYYYTIAVTNSTTGAQAFSLGKLIVQH